MSDRPPPFVFPAGQDGIAFHHSDPVVITLAMTEADLPNLTDAQLLDLHRAMEPDDPMLDAVLDQIEKRELDL